MQHLKTGLLDSCMVWISIITAPTNIRLSLLYHTLYTQVPYATLKNRIIRQLHGLNLYNHCPDKYPSVITVVS